MSAASVLLAVHCKKGEPVELDKALKAYIQQNYSLDPQTADDLKTLQSWRADALRQSAGAGSSVDEQKASLQRYYGALGAVEVRFPISCDKEHVALSFLWRDSFNASKKASIASVHYERAAILFNLAALCSQQAVFADRGTAAGAKTAAHNFQVAAWCFQRLRDEVALKVAAAGSPTTDLTPDCLGLLERLMLAEAQECFFERASADRKSPKVCAKLAAQVGTFYDEVASAMARNALAAHFEKTWASHIHLKQAEYKARALYHSSVADRAEEEANVNGFGEKIAEEIAKLQAAMKAIDQVKDKCKSASSDIVAQLRTLEETVARALDKAKRENDQVYMLRIPSSASVSKIAGACLVKGIPMEGLESDLQAASLFAAIVPDSRTKDLSKYTEMVDELTREQASSMEQASEQIRLKLAEYDLPEILRAVSQPAQVPEELKDELEMLQSRGGVAVLTDLMAQRGRLRDVCEQELTAASQLLDAEQAEDAKLRDEHGARWSRPQSDQLNLALRDKMRDFARSLETAQRSDDQVQAQYEEKLERFSKLLMDLAEDSIMPRLAQPLIEVDEPSTLVASHVEDLLGQLQMCADERASLEERLKTMKAQDDILPKVMASKAEVDDLFQEEIKKYAPLVEQINANLVSQEALLTQLGEKMATFHKIYPIQSWREECSKVVSNADQTIKQFQSLREGIADGLRFYSQLQEAIQAFKQQCNDFAYTRSLQKEDLLQHMQHVSVPVAQMTPASPAQGKGGAGPFFAQQPPAQFPAGPPSRAYSAPTPPLAQAQMPLHPPPPVPGHVSQPAPPPPQPYVPAAGANHLARQVSGHGFPAAAPGLYSVQSGNFGPSNPAFAQNAAGLAPRGPTDEEIAMQLHLEMNGGRPLEHQGPTGDHGNPLLGRR